MAGEKLNDTQIFNENDPFDINELAALNNDISPEFIEQLQNKVSQNVSEFNANSQPSEDETLFEEQNKQESEPVNEVPVQEDSFMKKYKAKQKEKQFAPQEEEPSESEQEEKTAKQEDVKPPENDKKQEEIIENNAEQATENDQEKSSDAIEDLSSGNITEKPMTSEQIAYNESLELADNDINYSKYVIYVNPENKNFIESLTVKERKNLINRILREQDDVAITKRKLGVLQTILRHSIVAIITIAIAIPVIYTIVNTSLEVSIDNYRRSQSNFQTLYREHGKIKAPHK